MSFRHRRRQMRAKLRRRGLLLKLALLFLREEATR